MAVILAFWQFLLKFGLIKYRDGIFYFISIYPNTFYILSGGHVEFYFSFCHIVMNNLSFMTSALSMFCF